MIEQLSSNKVHDLSISEKMEKQKSAEEDRMIKILSKKN